MRSRACRFVTTRMTAAGLVVLHNSPRSLRLEPDRVMRELLTCVRRHAGSGLPAGRDPAAGGAARQPVAPAPPGIAPPMAHAWAYGPTNGPSRGSVAPPMGHACCSVSCSRRPAGFARLTGQMSTQTYELTALQALEAESIHIFREVAAEFERPVLLFSGGKDSVVMLHLAAKAFWPAPIPFPAMHVDTGHNFPEVLDFRDRTVERLGLRLVVASVEDSIDNGRVRERPDKLRNPLQTVTLLDAIEAGGFDAVFGGARRDEEKARAKERVFSFRDEFGQWDPKNQRPELWTLYNGRHHQGEHIRVFPLSNWTELDIWSTSPGERRAAEHLLRPRARGLHPRRDAAAGQRVHHPARERRGRDETVRYRTVGDVPFTGAVESTAATYDEVIAEVAATRDHRARRDPGRRPAHRGRHGRPQARGVLLDHGAAPVRHCRQCRRRQVHADRPPAVRHQVDLRRPARRGRAHLAPARRRTRQPRAAHRRAAGRARAGHHHRRRLPLLRDPQAHVHHRRHAGPHAVHAQHGHRRLDRDARAGPGRRPQRHPRAVAPARVPRVAAAGAAPRALRQQDGPRRLRRGGLRHDQGRVPRRSRPSSTSATCRSSRSARSRATTSSTAPTTCPGTTAPRCCTTSKTCTSRATAT